MSIVQPSDGHAIYEDISPGQGQSVYGPRLQQIASAGFRVVVNYALLYDTTANMIAYINYADYVGLRVAVAMDLVCSPPGGSLASAFPTLYTESGSQGTTNFNAFGTYVVSQVKNLVGTWGYYIADEPQDANHATIKSFHDAVVAADSSHPTLIICDSDTTTNGISNFWSVHNANWSDCCSVGGDDFYPIGLATGSVSGYTIGSAAGAIQSYCNSNSVQSAMVLQAFNFSGTTPSFNDMVAMCNQALSHMQPRLLLWYSYQNIWGCPANIHDSTIPADPQAATLWSNLTRAIASVPSRWIEEIEQDSPLHIWRCNDPLCFTYGDDLLTTQGTTINGFVTRQQASLIPTDLDPACSFNGSSSAITLVTTGFPSGAQPWTLGGMLQYSALPGAGVYQFIAGFGTFASAQSVNIGYNGDNQNLTLDLHGIADVDTGIIPSLNTPYLLIATYDGSTVNVYVNGTLKASRSASLNVVYGSAYIGRGTGGNNFSGLIKDVFLFNAALSASRIAAYQNAIAGISPLVATLGNLHPVRAN